MKSIVCAITLILFISLSALAQSRTTESLHKQNHEALALFFYNNTLRMINQTDNKEFDELIKNIEKLKFLMINKTKGANFGPTQYKKLVSGYKSEAYEEIMTSRHQGKNFDVFLKETGGKTQGMVVAVNDSSNLYVLDIVGSIALDKVTSLFKEIDQSSEIGKKIKEFTKKD